MSATIAIAPGFIEALRRRVPAEIHPSGQAWIREYLYRMRDANPLEVLRLAARVRAIVARELRYAAENRETFGGLEAGRHLRRQADEWGRNSQTTNVN